MVDDTYSEIFATLSGVTESTDGTFQPATATNLVAQVGNVSTARETRLVAAEIQTPPLLSALLLFGAVRLRDPTVMSVESFSGSACHAPVLVRVPRLAGWAQPESRSCGSPGRWAPSV